MTYNELKSVIARMWANNIESPRTRQEKIASTCLHSDEVQNELFASKQKIFSNAWKAYQRLEKEESERKSEARGGAYWSVFGF